MRLRSACERGGPGRSTAPTAATSKLPQATITVLFGGTIFLGAFLLFAVEPLVGRYVLPWFGGSPGVWTTCMLFFQAALLAGYCYAYGSLRWLPPRGQAIVHLALMVIALACLPVAPSSAWRPPPGAGPTWPLILLLCRTVGSPFFVLAGSGPLLQAWLGRTAGRSPYRLFALSNLGSLLALLLYPSVVEPLLTRKAQSLAWSTGFGIYALFCSMISLRAWRGSAADSPEELNGRDMTNSRPPAAHRTLWILLPCCASGLLLAITNALCQDVAVVPFLWVLPLTLYLLSFVVAFDSPRWYRRGATIGAMLGCLGLLCLINLGHPVGLIAANRPVLGLPACGVHHLPWRAGPSQTSFEPARTLLPVSCRRRSTRRHLGRAGRPPALQHVPGAPTLPARLHRAWRVLHLA